MKHKKKLIVVIIVIVVLVLWKLGGLSWTVAQVLPPLVKVTNHSCRDCAHNEKGVLDYGCYFKADLANNGGSGYVVVVAELLKNHSVWLRTKKRIYMEGGTTKTVDLWINDGITLLTGGGHSYRLYVE